MSVEDRLNVDTDDLSHSLSYNIRHDEDEGKGVGVFGVRPLGAQFCVRTECLDWTCVVNFLRGVANQTWLVGQVVNAPPLFGERGFVASGINFVFNWFRRVNSPV